MSIIYNFFPVFLFSFLLGLAISIPPGSSSSLSFFWLPVYYYIHYLTILVFVVLWCPNHFNLCALIRFTVFSLYFFFNFITLPTSALVFNCPFMSLFLQFPSVSWLLSWLHRSLTGLITVIYTFIFILPPLPTRLVWSHLFTYHILTLAFYVVFHCHILWAQYLSVIVDVFPFLLLFTISFTSMVVLPQFQSPPLYLCL